MQVANKYVVERDGNLYVAGTRIPVYTVVTAWRQGYSPEEIRGDFDGLSLLSVFAAITYYLENQQELDAFFREQDELFARLKAESEAKNPEFYAMMRERFTKYRESHGEQLSEHSQEQQPTAPDTPTA